MTRPVRRMWPPTEGSNISTVGIILMVAGVIGLLSPLFLRTLTPTPCGFPGGLVGESGSR